MVIFFYIEDETIECDESLFIEEDITGPAEEILEDFEVEDLVPLNPIIQNTLDMAVSVSQYQSPSRDMILVRDFFMTYTIRDLVVRYAENCMMELSYQQISNAAENNYEVYSIAYTSKLFSLEYRQHQAFTKAALYLLNDWSLILNIEQSIISIEHRKQLKMHILGSAGTGKSQVIKAILHFATTWKMEQTVIVTSFTGTAAKSKYT
jgi:hypothetical protein